MQIFSATLKRQMKDCLLALFWPKKQIYEFFADCTVPSASLATIRDWDEKGLSRSAMIDAVFESLTGRTDNGTMHFDVMLEQLVAWQHYDPYWFGDQGKLDLSDARRKVAALRSAKTISVDQSKKRAEKQRAKRSELEVRHQSLDEMRSDFQSIATGSETLQARGYAFETFLARMARFYGLSMTGSFRIKGTQIDGSVKYDGENYNIEAKWHDRSMSDEPLMAFCHKQQINMHGRGIFISVNGYMPNTVTMLEKMSVKNTVLMDGEDITLILSDLLTLPEALDAKVGAAQTRGQFYIHPVTLRSKIS